VIDTRHCVAAVVYVYGHHARDLPKRLTQGFHDHHEFRRQRCTCISTKRAAWRSPCSRDWARTCNSLRIT
jgi:hypothetical protein